MDTAGSTCSDLNRAAVHEQFNTGDVAAVVRGEEYRRLAEIVRRAEPAEQEAKPLIDTIEPVRITEEPLVSSGSAFWTANSRPRTLVLNVLSKCSSVISPSVPNS